MSWGRSLMGKQRKSKNCWGPFGCIDKNGLLSFLIVCRNRRRAAAILTWGLPALGCAPPFSPASVAAAALLSLLPFLLSLSSSFSHLSLFSIDRENYLSICYKENRTERKSSVLWKHFSYIFCSASNLIYFMPPEEPVVWDVLHPSPLSWLLLLVLCVCETALPAHTPSTCLYQPWKMFKIIFPLAFTAISSFHEQLLLLGQML